jgi:type IV pilus assembly protein PilM
MGLFYKDKPVLGFDIGRSSMKVMQIVKDGKKDVVIGYGAAPYDSKAVEQGVITDHEKIIQAAHKLLTSGLVGKITTRRVAVSLPNEFSFSRVISLPKISGRDLEVAVQDEINQSIPLSADKLYYDYSVSETPNDSLIEVQVVAAPKAIIDSYKGMFDALGLEIALIESNITATTRMVAHSEAHDVDTVIVDFGSSACDISVFDGSAIRATGTVDCSSERITQNIAAQLGINLQQSHSIKTRYGIEYSKKQDRIVKAAEPELNKLISEIRKVMRYFTDRDSANGQIKQIIILGGGANLPGLANYITNKARVATRLCYPWSNLSFGKLEPPLEFESTLYTTAGGLALVQAEELAS